MGRKRTGTGWEKAPGVWVYRITLKDGSTYTSRIPPRASGAPITKEWAKKCGEAKQEQYDEGTWSPPVKAPAGATPHASPTLTVGAWAKQWADGLTHATAYDDQYALKKYFADDPVAAIPLTALTTADLAGWVERLKRRASRLGGTLAPRSVLRYAGTVGRALDHAVALGLIPASPYDRLPQGTLPALRDKVPGARRTWRYSTEEIGALLWDVRIPPDRRVVYALAFATGGRFSELAALRWSDWEPRVTPLGRMTLARGVTARRGAKNPLRLPTERIEKGTKTGAVKEAPVHPVLAHVLEAWRARGWEDLYGRAPGPNDLIVPTRQGRARLATASWNLLQRDCTTIGIRPRKLHGTRHTTIRQARDAGADREAIRGITHAAPSKDAFDGYDDPSWERVCREVLKLDLGPIPGDSATDNAPAAEAVSGNTMNHRLSEITASRGASALEGRFPQETGRKAPGETRGEEAETGDSAPDSATTGALSGEVVAYRYLERVELEDGACDWRVE